MKNNRVIIAGSRTCKENDQTLFDKISTILSSLDYEDLEIVSGKARGADRLGENFAELNLLPLKTFPARWDKFDKMAGYIRNKDMAEYGTHLIALWDGKSRGTKMMIDLAKKFGLKIRLIWI